MEQFQSPDNGEPFRTLALFSPVVIITCEAKMVNLPDFLVFRRVKKTRFL